MCFFALSQEEKNLLLYNNESYIALNCHTQNVYAESNSKEISIGALQGNLLLGLPFFHLISLKELGVCGTVK